MQRLLGTSGRRVHALILVVSVVYVVVHASFGLRVFQPDDPLSATLLVVTILVAFGNLFLAAPVWVYAGVALLRGPRPLVPLPARVDEAQLPEIVVQIPGRNEPFPEVQRSIESVLKADYPPEKLRVQFIDNSDDARWKEVVDYYRDEPRVFVEHRDGTKGFKGGNLNIGLARLGDFENSSQVLIGLLDVGDTFAPLALRPMATEFVHDPRLAFVQGMFRTGNPDETIINWSEGLVGDAARRFTEGYMAHFGIPTMNGHCALLRLQALNEIGRWNESRVAEDWSTGIGMLVDGWRGKWVDYAPSDPDMVSTELVPSDIRAQQKQKRRWSTGGTELAKYHLVRWMGSSLPWHHRMALFLRMGAIFSVLPAFVLQMLIPLWVALAVSGEASRAAATFGILSALVQSPFMAANAAAAINYVREGRPRTAMALMVAYPIQALWRLPLFAHAALGIAEGLSRGLKEFVITPKTRANDTLIGSIRSQSLVIGVSTLAVLPLLVYALLQPQRVDPLLAAGAALPTLTVLALFTVPATQWLRHQLRSRRRRSRGVSPEA
ncbi:MAG: glycosyltransferase family 2 protein [Myxococcota bacterium]